MMLKKAVSWIFLIWFVAWLGFVWFAVHADAASSRPLMCQVLSGKAADMKRDLESTDFRPEHYSEVWQQRVGRWTQRCAASDNLKQCVYNLCMESPA